jgi:pantoate kinase
MQNENEEFDTQTEETVVEQAEEVEEVEAPELKTAIIQKEKFRKKLEEAERKLAELSKQPKTNTALDVGDYIDISTSLSGLDPVEQAYLAKLHKLTGEPMKEIRESEDFQLWNSAYRQKQEKERALKPNATQELENEPKGLVSKLRSATVAEKEEMLKAAGLYKEFRPRGDRSNIGVNRR